ncbi:MAG: hypothetical protein HYU54_01180 [Actinobacteria bacterium]|nr:hypothetical protein [Actinomycetota bacterium]
MRRHELDPPSLVFGLLFLVVGIVFFAGSPDLARIGPRWIWPVPALALGLLVFLYGVKRLPRKEPERETEPADATHSEDPPAENTSG